MSDNEIPANLRKRERATVWMRRDLYEAVRDSAKGKTFIEIRMDEVVEAGLKALQIRIKNGARKQK